MKKLPVRLIRLWLFVTCITLFLYTLYFFITGEVFSLKTVYIAGDPMAVTDLTIFQKKRNVLLLSKSFITNEIITKNPWIATITITKFLPQSLYIDIQKRSPAVMLDSGQRLYVDKDGVVLPVIAGITKDYPLLNCPISVKSGQSIVDQSIRQGVQIVFNLESFADFQPTSLTCTDSQMMLIDFPQTRVLYSSRQNPDSLVASLQLLFKQFRIEGKWPKMIDLRFDKPVLKMSETNEATDTTDIENTQ